MIEVVIVLASDHVGLGVVRHLGRSGHRVELLGLDPTDPGGRNAEIQAAYLEAEPTGEIVVDPAPDLRGRRPRLGLLAWWPRILRGPILDVPELGWLNIHPSYLPSNRGKHPNFWCLVEGTPCGVALQFIDRGIDTGPVLARAELPVTWEDTGKSVYERSRELALDLFREHLEDILAGRLAGTVQESGAGSFHQSSELDPASTIELDRTYTARDLLNLLRARTFPPHPAAQFSDGGRRYSVEVRIRELARD